MPDFRRLKKEIAEASSTQSLDGSDISIVMNGDDLSHLKANFKGPADTPFEDGLFELDVIIPDNYPFGPPKVKFITPIYHPNVSSQTGAICLDILKNEWTPALSLRATVLSVQQLLQSPEPTDPQDAQVAGHYLRDYPGFSKTAKLWTKVYASCKSSKSISWEDVASLGADEAVVRRMVEMGFDIARAIRALHFNGGDENASIEIIKPRIALFWKPNFEGAAQSFEKAVSCYKSASRPDLAIPILMECADCWKNADSNFMAAKSAEHAAKLAESIDPLQSCQYYQRASEYFILNGTSDRAADVLEKAAKCAEDAKDYKRAVEMFTESASLLEQEDKLRLAIDVIKKATTFCIRCDVQDKTLQFLQKQISIYQILKNNNGTAKALLSLVIYLLHMSDEIEAQKEFEKGIAQDLWTREDMNAANALLEAYSSGDADMLKRASQAQTIGFLDNQIVRVARNLKPGIPCNTSSNVAQQAMIPGFAPMPTNQPDMVNNDIQRNMEIQQNIAHNNTINNYPSEKAPLLSQDNEQSKDHPNVPIPGFSNHTYQQSAQAPEEEEEGFC